MAPIVSLSIMNRFLDKILLPHSRYSLYLTTIELGLPRLSIDCASIYEYFWPADNASSSSGTRFFVSCRVAEYIGSTRDLYEACLITAPENVDVYATYLPDTHEVTSTNITSPRLPPTL